MIRRELKSRLIELEKRYIAAVQAKRDEALAPAQWAYLHAIEVAAVALYGEPKMEEPLSVAQSRMQESWTKNSQRQRKSYGFVNMGKNCTLG